VSGLRVVDIRKPSHPKTSHRLVEALPVVSFFTSSFQVCFFNSYKVCSAGVPKAFGAISSSSAADAYLDSPLFVYFNREPLCVREMSDFFRVADKI